MKVKKLLSGDDERLDIYNENRIMQTFTEAQ